MSADPIKSPSNHTQEMVEVYEGLSKDADGNGKGDTVNTDDCIETGRQERASHPNKYKLNADFNQHSPEKEASRDHQETANASDPSFEDWMGDVLKGQKWDSGKTEPNGNINANDNPYLSVSAKTNTIIKNAGAANTDEAEWRKYKNDEFAKNLKNLPTLQNQDLGAGARFEADFVADTFANKSKNKSHSLLSESFTPSSPLKLFGDRQDTYTKDRFKNILKNINNGEIEEGEVQEMSNDVSGVQEDAASETAEDYSEMASDAHPSEDGGSMNKMLQDSDKLFQKAVASGSAFKLPQQESSENETSMTYSDKTSDADEFSSSRSAGTFSANALIKDGNAIYQHLRRKFSTELPNPDSEVSDYTSDGEELKTTANFAGPQFESIPECTAEDVTETLEEFKREYKLSGRHLSGIDRAVSAPKIATESALKPVALNQIATPTSEQSTPSPARKYKGMNFISAEEYKDKVFDKQQNKYVSKEEFEMLYGKRGSPQHKNVSVDDGFTSLSDTANSVIPAQKGQKQPEVSFKLPDPLRTNTTDILDNDAEEYAAGSDATADGDLSFSQTDQALVSAITEKYPEDDWDRVEELDIQNRKLDKARGLDKFTPNVWILNASHNDISHADGIPQGVRILKLNYNSFNSVSSFTAQNLQILELDNNSLENLSGLSSLSNLTKLSVASNRLTNIDHLRNLPMLRYLDLSDNKLAGRIDFARFELWLLEELKLDGNKITGLINLQSLPNLIDLSANGNSIRSLTCNEVLHKSLKRLSLNSNKLSTIDLSPFPHLMRLHLDRNDLVEVSGLSRYLEKASFKYQSNSGDVGAAVIKSAFQNENLRKLSFTGGAIAFDSLSNASMFTCVTRLNLSAMGLDAVPSRFSTLFPMLTELNLNFNNIQSLAPISGLTKLRKLNLLGNSIKDLSEVVVPTKSIRKTLKLIDLRVNPVSKGFYPYVFWDGSTGDDQPQLTDPSPMDETTMMNLKDYDDIEAFSVEYSKLYDRDELSLWNEKNQRFSTSKEKRDYQTKMIVWFYHLNYLDGLRVDSAWRNAELQRISHFSN